MAYGLKSGDDDTCKETWERVLKAGYGEVAREPMPNRFRELLHRLEDAESHDRRPVRRLVRRG